jgi:hypothetical protein
MRILVCGDREWNNREAIKRELLKILEVDTIDCVIEGEARGADIIARDICEKELNIMVYKYPANWAKFGKPAGVLRNIQMLKRGQPQLVLAFHPDITKSKGTAHMIKIAKEANVPVLLFKE